MNPTDPVSVTLEAQQWNIVLGVLVEAPWRVADPLIRAISQQAKEAETPPQAAKPNGHGEVEARLAA